MDKGEGASETSRDPANDPQINGVKEGFRSFQKGTKYLTTPPVVIPPNPGSGSGQAGAGAGNPGDGHLLSQNLPPA